MSTEKKEAGYKEAKAAQDTFRGCVENAMSGEQFKLQELVRDFARKTPGLSEQDVIMGFQSEGQTLIHIASKSGHEAVFDYVIGCLDGVSRKAAVNKADDKGYTPLINATVAENAQIMSKLLDFGALVNARNQDLAAAIHFAAGDGSVVRTKLLVDAGADVNLASRTGGNCLHWAAGKGRAEVLKYLLSLSPGKLDINATSAGCPTAVVMAAVASCDAGVQILVEAGADTGLVLTGNLTLLHVCAENDLRAAVTAILRTPSGLKCALLETDDGNKPVHLAAMVGNESMVALLLPSSNEPGDVASILRDGKERMKRWEERHAATQRHSNGGGGSSNNNSGGNKPRSTRPLEPVSPAASPAAEAEAEAAKDEGNNLFKVKKYPDALERYTTAIRLKGDDATFWSNRSACFLAMGDAPNALLDAEVCRRLRPDWTKGCYRLAAARLELGMFEDAAVAAFEGLKLDNNNLPLKVLTQEAVKRGKEEYQKSLSK
jgi:ankyrin repeat protein